MYVTFLRSDGVKFNVDNKRWALINELGGISTPPITVNTTNLVDGVGSVVTSKRVNSRDMTFELIARQNDKMVLRNEALTFFNPEFTYTVFISYLGKEQRQIDCELYNVAIPALNIRERVHVTVTMLAASPYFKSNKQFNVLLTKSNPKFGFPYISPIDRGFAFGVATPVNTIRVNNKGDVRTPVNIKIRAIGTITNPVVVFNDKPFKLLLKLNDKDVVNIRLDTNPPRITKNDVNCIQYLSRDSDITELIMPMGYSMFAYNADSGSENMIVDISYFEQYLGVV